MGVKLKNKAEKHAADIIWWLPLLPVEILNGKKKSKNKVNEIVLQHIIKVYHPDFLS